MYIIYVYRYMYVHVCDVDYMTSTSTPDKKTRTSYVHGKSLAEMLKKTKEHNTNTADKETTTQAYMYVCRAGQIA